MGQATEEMVGGYTGKLGGQVNEDRKKWKRKIRVTDPTYVE